MRYVQFDIAMRADRTEPSFDRGPLAALLGGCAIGTLGGLIGLGGAEFRLPLLIGVFGFVALSAVILNKAMSLAVVASGLVFRSAAVPLDQVLAEWPAVVNILAGSLAGAWLGADWATRVHPRTLYRTIALLLVLIAIALVVHPMGQAQGQPALTGTAQVAAGLVAGLGIGIVASLMGVAGGELLIPTFMLLFGADIKLAGSLSLAVSLPTLLVGFARYSRDRSFRVLRDHRRFAAFMAIGSVLGVMAGGWLLGSVSSAALLPLLAIVLVLSALKVWRHA